jgi:hypothetical protein
MNSKVKVVADATSGAVIVQSEKNPDYGYVRLEQPRTGIDDNGFLRTKKLSTLVHGTITELQEAGFYNGQELPGKIVISESLTPFNKKDPNRDLKIAGETGIPCTINGEAIYRKTVYSLASNCEDVLIKHDNVEQLKAAYTKTEKVAVIKPNDAFDNI